MKTKTLPKGAVACALAVMLASPTNLAIAHEITAGQTDGIEPVTVVDETNVDAQDAIEPVTDTDEAIVEAQDAIEPMTDTDEAIVDAQGAITPVSVDNVTKYRPYNNDSCRTSFVRNDKNGNLERIQWTGSELVRETLNNTYSVTKRFTYPASTYRPSKLVDSSYFRWGGFFSGKTYDFVVCGQKNPQKSDDVIVVRVSKYDKAGQFKGACEFKDGRNNIPEDLRPVVNDWGSSDVFQDSSVAFSEVGNNLHIRSSHETYSWKCTSMHLVIDTNTMRVTDSMTYVTNASAATLGYASCAFAQRLTPLNGTMYTADLSTSYPRGVILKQCGKTNHVATLLSIRGEKSVSATGVTLGGMESSATKTTVLVNGVTIDQSASTGPILSSEPRNVFVAVSTDSPKLSRVEYLTKYSKNGDKGAGLPKMVKLSEDRFCVIWAEVDTGNTQTGTVMWCIVDGNGKLTGDIKRMSGYLSDCDPVLHNGKVVWYAQRLPNDKTPVYYEINPGKIDTPATCIFYDVTPNMAHYDDVVWVGANGISAGFVSTGGKRAFKPLDMTTRAQTAEFLFNLAQHWGVIDANWQPTTAQKNAFTDVNDSTPYARAIRWLASTGISEGWQLSNGKYEFRPNAKVARCDMATFMFRMATRYKKVSSTWQPTTTQKKAFTDVNDKTPHAREVYWLAAKGISEGWKLSNGKAEFRPYATTTRIDYAAFVHRLDSI